MTNAQQAKRRLIAAAPELLEALKLVVEVIGELPSSGFNQGVSKRYDLALRAIAKAEGK